ncbi:MAG: hypothetical protein PHV68_00065 [Candidatus Gastranaerophilales bacterium]|nr:hypothetical protein [Candidatus Gastranaerophilales bacterium]
MTEKLTPNNLLVSQKVKSKTSNNEYEVYIFDSCVVCTCPAGGKKQLCKHLISLIHNNFELLKEKAPNFLPKLIQAIEVKNSKEIPYKDKFKEYAKVMYLNKDIVDESIQNIHGLIQSDIEELTQFEPLVSNYRIYELYEFMQLSRKSLYNLFFAKNDELLNNLEKLKFIKFHPLSVDDFLEKIYFTKDELIKILKLAEIKFPKKSNKNVLLRLARENNLLDEEIKNYTLISATELFITSKDIISFLHKNRSKYVDDKKILNISFFKEDLNIAESK